MTDLSPAPDATVTCPNCGAQNDGRSTSCRRCGALLGDASGDVERGDLELEEVWRAASSDGFDTDMVIEGDELRCPVCGAGSPLTDVPLAGRVVVRDTPTNRTDLVVLTVRCPVCGAAGRAIAPRSPRDTDAEVRATTEAGGERVGPDTVEGPNPR